MTEFISINDKEYPESLRKIKKPPKRLYYKGDINLLRSSCFSIVGSRNITSYGEYIERKFVRKIATTSATIVSRVSSWSGYNCS